MWVGFDLLGCSLQNYTSLEGQEGDLCEMYGLPRNLAFQREAKWVKFSVNFSTLKKLDFYVILNIPKQSLLYLCSSSMAFPKKNDRK